MSIPNKIISKSLINNNNNSKKSKINISDNKIEIFPIKNNDLPLIKLKNKSNNCNIKKRNLFIKKLIFNPIPCEKKIKKSLLSPIHNSSLSKKNIFPFSEMKLLSKRKLQPLNLRSSTSEINIKNNISENNKNKDFRKISYNNILDNNKYYIDKNINPIKNRIKNKKLNFKIIELLTKYKFRGYKNITEKSKFKYIYNNKRIQEFKKSILDLYNKIDANQKKYLNNENFVHYFLFHTERIIHPNHNSFSAPNINSNSSISYNYNLNEINPKYEYVDYFGKESKIITKLSSDLNNINSNNKSNNENNVILNKQLRVPKQIALKDSEDYKNKNYIKILEKKKKNEKLIEAEKIKENKNMMNIIEISKKGFVQLNNNKMKDFEGLIKYAMEKHKSVIKKLDEMIEMDKEQYEKDFNEININLDN